MQKPPQSAADFGGEIVELAVKQVELFQSWQQGFEWGKPMNAYAVVEY
jgi:hypothetical protein